MSSKASKRKRIIEGAAAAGVQMAARTGFGPAKKAVKKTVRKRIIQGAAAAGLVLAGGAGVYAAHKAIKNRAAGTGNPSGNSGSAPIKTTLSLNPTKSSTNRREESTQKLIRQNLPTQVSTPPVLSAGSPVRPSKEERVKKAKQIAGLATTATKVGGIRSKREVPSRKIKAIDAENSGRWGLITRSNATTKSAKAAAAKTEAKMKLNQNVSDRKSAEKTLKVLPALPKVRTKRKQ